MLEQQRKHPKQYIMQFFMHPIILIITVIITPRNFLRKIVNNNSLRRHDVVDELENILMTYNLHN